MATILHGWAGDNAIKLVGRQANQLILAGYTEGTDQNPSGWDLTLAKGDLSVSCLTPQAYPAQIEKVVQIGSNAWALDLVSVITTNCKPWKPGVHLFCIRRGKTMACLATAKIDSKLPRVTPTPSGKKAPKGMKKGSGR